MIDQYVLATNDDGDLAIRTVQATESSSVTDTTSVITATDDGKLAVRVVGGGGGGDSHNLGYYETPEDLRTAHPTASAGDFAIVNSTDTVWIWDTTTSAWKDGDTKGQVTSVNNQTGDVTVQATLVSGTNIKSVNNNTLLGAGNLELSTYLTYPAGWTTNSTTKAFCDDIAADTTATVGKAYLGEVTLSDMPAGIVNAEIVVEIMDGTTAANKVIKLTLSSGSVAPYMWIYTYWNGGTNVSGWQALGGGDSIQVDPMPAATSSNVGDIVQYVGETNANYTKGYFYKADGTLVNVPMGGTIANVNPSGASVTIDYEELVDAFVAITGWMTRDEVISELKNYSGNTNTWYVASNELYINGLGSIDLNTYTNVATFADYGGASQVTFKINDFQEAHQELQNPHWTRTDVQPSGSSSPVTDISTATVTQALASGYIYNCTVDMTSVEITLPATPSANFMAQLNFTSGSTATTFTSPAGMVWLGDDATGSAFVPAANKRYVVMVFYDGVSFRGIVQAA